MSGRSTMVSEEGQIISRKLGKFMVKRIMVAKWLKGLSRYRDVAPNFFKDKN